MNAHPWHPWLRRAGLIISLAGLTAACGPGFAVDVVTPTLPVATDAPTNAPTDAPTESPTSAPTDAPTQAPTAAPTLAPTQAPSATPDNAAAGDPPLEGLTYSVYNDGIYWVDATGQPHKIFDRPEAVISPDGTEALYADGDDIWLADLSNGSATNLTNTPDRVEHSPRWWPARPDLVVFGSYAADRELAFGPYLFPTIVNRDGTGYQMIDEEVDAFSLALSPDGHTLAYGVGEVGYLYDLETGLRSAFHPQDYGVITEGSLPAPTAVTVGGPAFSSDGVHMSWTLGMFFEDGTNNIAQLIVDLPAHTSVAMHVYHLPPSDAVPAPGVWSPDGAWLAYYTLSDNPADAGMWAAHVGGAEERYLGAGTGAVWRDDGGWLAFNADGGQTILYHADGWGSTTYSGPVNGGVIGW
jgi:hypothetical protein